MSDQLSQDLKSLRIDPSRKSGDTGGRKWIFIGVLAVVAIALAALVAFMPSKLGLSSLGAKPREVEVAMVVRQSPSADSVVLTAGGYVVPRHRVDVASKIGGRVEQIFFEKGDFVRQGQVLAKLDDRESQVQLAQSRANKEAAQARLNEALAGSRPQEIERSRAAVEQAEANLRTTELNLNRARQLNKTGVLARQVLDDAQNAYDVAVAQLKVARENHELARLGPRKEQIDLVRAQLAEAEASQRWWETQIDNTLIRAPVDGTVLDRTVEKGEMVTTGFFGSGRGPKAGITSLANLRELEVELDINEADIAKVQRGQACTVSPDSYPDRKYKAAVREIAPEANRQKATIQVKVAVEQADSYLRPETNAKVNFLAEPRREQTNEERIVVPKAAVVNSEGSPAVFLMKEGRAVRQPVRTGRELWGQVEIASGLNGGEQLIVRGLEGIAAGEKVVLKQP